ncbi:MAG: GGDEF domain-containing protein [Solobacterium sp.]|nr:GGDEF domain-containing protein [Solobacterium sp.]
MWNYNFVIPGFLILLILLVYYLSRPQIMIRVNRVFVFLLTAESLVIILDLISSKADESFEMFSSNALYMLNTLYFVFFLVRIYLFYLLTSNVVGAETDKSYVRKTAEAIVVIISEVIAVSSYYTGAVFRITEAGYQSGPLYNILYFCSLFYILLSLVVLFRFRAKLSQYELISAGAYNLILLAGTVIRFIMPQILVMNLFCLMAILIIYLTFQNPDLYSSDRGPSFNRRAFRTTLDEVRITQPFRLLCFVLRSYSEEREIYGYHQMDQGIKLISEYLAELCEEEQIFYLRNGCFAIMGSDQMEWDAIQQDISQRFQRPWMADEADLFLDVSFVRISSRSGYDDTDTIINRLLTAFYETGKRSSSGNMIDLDEIHDLDRQVDVKRELEKAIEENSVEIFLQPLIECDSGTMCGAEVLARIRNSEGRILSPGIFIPIAEQNGQINRLGSQVFEKACRFISEGKLAATGLQWVNVNLSPIQCMNRDLSDQFTEILDRYGVDAKYIHLEITEASMIDLSLLQKQIQTLQENGFRFALDDYGTGYSNLTRVKHYPFINIKLDMEVVWDYYKERDALLPAIIKAFKQLNFSVTAEGIETEEMGKVMKAAGCDYLQGYYFSKPLPADEFVAKYSV